LESKFGEIAVKPTHLAFQEDLQAPKNPSVSEEEYFADLKKH